MSPTMELSQMIFLILQTLAVDGSGRELPNGEESMVGPKQGEDKLFQCPRPSLPPPQWVDWQTPLCPTSCGAKGAGDTQPKPEILTGH